jgi:DNA invertase Pin-like site-specific DNA recombinase
MLVGYMRVSTESDRQVLDLQRDALVAAGVDERHLFEDRVSGSHGDRTGLAKALAFIKAGDCLVVWKLDRLRRSLPHLLATITDLKRRGIEILVGHGATAPSLSHSAALEMRAEGIFAGDVERALRRVVVQANGKAITVIRILPLGRLLSKVRVQPNDGIQLGPSPLPGDRALVHE